MWNTGIIMADCVPCLLTVLSVHTIPRNFGVAYRSQYFTPLENKKKKDWYKSYLVLLKTTWYYNPLDQSRLAGSLCTDMWWRLSFQLPLCATNHPVTWKFFFVCFRFLRLRSFPLYTSNVAPLHRSWLRKCKFAKSQIYKFCLLGKQDKAELRCPWVLLLGRLFFYHSVSALNKIG